MLRTLLIWLLAFALPLQVANAVAMTGSAHQAADQAAAKVAAAPRAASHAEAPPCHEAAEPSARAASPDPHAKSGCSTCAACCAMVALPTSLPVWLGTAAAPAFEPSATRAVGEFVTDGPQRPPKRSADTTC